MLKRAGIDTWRLICRVDADALGDKITLPSDEALEACLNAVGDASPATLCLTGPSAQGRVLAAAVRNFGAPPRSAVVPAWMARALHVLDGGLILVSLAKDGALDKATHVTFEPQSPDFFGLTDHKRVLEAALSQQFSTLTKGSVIDLQHDGARYALGVVELEPAETVSLIDTDIEIEIRIPVDASGQPRFLPPVPSAPIPATAVRPLAQGGRGVATAREYAHFTVAGLPLGCPVWLELRADGPAAGDFEAYADDTRGQSPSRLAHKWTHTYTTGSEYVQHAVILIPAVANTAEGCIHLGVWAYGCVSSSFLLSWHLQETPPAAPASLDDGVTVCRNCHETVPTDRLSMHQLHCERHRTFCPLCDKGVLKAKMTTHWHCQECSTRVALNSNEARAKHEELFHTPCECASCGAMLPIPALMLHRQTSCSRRMVECQFCHLQAAAGPPPSDPADIFLGYTRHESECGGRTDHCPTCQAFVRLRDMAAHQLLHDTEQPVPTPPRLAMDTPPSAVCASKFCARATGAADTLGLCNPCRHAVGGLAADGVPANLATLVRYFMRLRTIGCGLESCANTANCRVVAPGGEPAAHGLALAVALAKASLAPGGSPLPICELTQEQALRRRADDLCALGFELRWCVRALRQADGNVDAAAAWLLSNAPPSTVSQ